MVKFVSANKNIQEFLDERPKLPDHILEAMSVFDEVENWTDEEWAEHEERLREYAKTLPEVICG